MRTLFSEAVARLERAAAQLQAGATFARTLSRLDEQAVATDPELARARLEDLLLELSLALGALGQATGATAAERARATAERLAAGRKVRRGAKGVDPEVAHDVAEVRAGRLPGGFEALSVVRALLA